MATTRYGLTGPLAAYPGFEPKAEGASSVRRGKSARGRARARGRRLWWLIAVVRIAGLS